MNNLDRISLMRNDLDELKENERQLDSLIEKIKQCSKRQSDSKLAYVTSQDLHNIDMYRDQMIMVVKAPPESQLILMDGVPHPLVLKSEKDEIDIFFCPDPSSGGSLQKATASLDSDSEEEGASTSTRPHRKAAAAASANKRRNLGSAQRNLSKAFEEMVEPRTAKTKSNLLKAFNATVTRESSEESATKHTNEDSGDEEVAATNSFKLTTITTKDLMLLNDPTSEELVPPSFGIKKDVKMSLFSPQKNLNGASTWTEIPEMQSFSPTFPFSHSDDPAAGFFALEPEAEYNFLLDESEGIMDLFDYKI